MKRHQGLLTILLITITFFSVSSVMAMDLSDNVVGNYELNSNNVANSTSEPYLDGPRVITSIERTDDNTLKIIFNTGNNYYSTIPARQSAMCTALANNLNVYLYKVDTTVYGVITQTF